MELSIRPFQHLSNASREYLQIVHKHPLGLKDDGIRISWSEDEGQVHSDLSKYLFGHNARIHTLIMTNLSG